MDQCVEVISALEYAAGTCPSPTPLIGIDIHHQMATVAIERLGQVLSPTEKITLGKSSMYAVPSWIEQGYTSIIGDSSTMTLEGLGAFGWKTAARVLWALKGIYSDNANRTDEIVKRILDEEFKEEAEAGVTEHVTDPGVSLPTYV